MKMNREELIAEAEKQPRHSPWRVGDIVYISHLERLGKILSESIENHTVYISMDNGETFTSYWSAQCLQYPSPFIIEKLKASKPLKRYTLISTEVTRRTASFTVEAYSEDEAWGKSQDYFDDCDNYTTIDVEDDGTYVAKVEDV